MLQVSAVDEAGHLGVSPHVKILVQSTASATTCPRTDVGGVCMAYRVAGDQDGDGIDNRWDFCPDSLAEAGTGSSSGWVATKAAGGGLAFRASGAKAVQIAGAAPRYEDLGGCTCYQIARELGLEGEGADAGCSVGTLERWRKRIADAARVD
jgi:hypothetical protein